MDLLNHREGGKVFYHVSSLLPYRNSKRLRDFEEIEISSKAAEVTVINKAENSEDFCLHFVQEFRASILRVYRDLITTKHDSNTLRHYQGYF
jgi:hypothetical protein